MGTTLGVAGALALTRLTRSLLFDLQSSVPMAIAAPVLLLLRVTLLAC
jgi:hypothetical protein